MKYFSIPTHKIAAIKAGVSTKGTRGECAQRICAHRVLEKSKKVHVDKCCKLSFT